MANLAFPQLSSDAQAQYPFQKRRLIQSPANSFADGTMIASNLNANLQTVWELAYIDLTAIDQAALQNLFSACQGPFLPFIFIDPGDNMLSSSSNLSSVYWQIDPLLSVTAGVTDPFGGNNAFLLVNSGQVNQQITQQIIAPADYHYCLSVYVSAPAAASIGLGSSAVSSQTQMFNASSNWTRLVNSNQLSDTQISFSVFLSVPPGESVAVFGPQLEPQLSPSRYRATTVAGGVYQNAHFLGDSITFESAAPGLFSTVISIETT